MPSSLRKYQSNPARLVSQARMLHSAKRKVTLVVEGDADYRFFRQWLVEESARLEKVDGKACVIDTWLEAQKHHFESLVCLADLDYDQILGNTPIQHDRFVYISLSPEKRNGCVECNDLESALIRSSALAKVMAQRLRGEALYERFDIFVKELRELLRKAAATVGAFRAADQLYYRRRHVAPIGEFEISLGSPWFSAPETMVDRGRLETTLRRSSRAGAVAMDAVCDEADRLTREYSDGWQLCRGHDLTTILALYLSETLHQRVTSQEIEKDLRMSIEASMIRQTHFGARILKLQQALGKDLIQI